MDINEIRYKNYKALFEQFKNETWAADPTAPDHGMLRRFAEAIHTSEAYMSHINTQYKPIGSRMARKFEKHLRLSDGYMDREHLIDEITPEQELVIGQIIELLKKNPKETYKSIRDLKAKIKSQT